jgi:hypothetical protein
MPTKSDLIELARICLEQARLARRADVIAALRRMAKDYRRRAAQLDTAPAADSESQSALPAHLC